MDLNKNCCVCCLRTRHCMSSQMVDSATGLLLMVLITFITSWMFLLMPVLLKWGAFSCIPQYAIAWDIEVRPQKLLAY